MKCFVVCLSVLAVCGASPLFSPLIHQYHAQDELGQYSFGYDGGPSAKQEIRTFDGVTRGGYSYVDSHGIVQSASYVADPVNGFRIAATNLPVAPAAPVVAPLVGPAPVEETAEVMAAKAAHMEAHAKALTRSKRSPVWPWTYGVAPLKVDGTVDETPEVKALTAAHLAAHAQARAQVLAPVVGPVVTPYVHLAPYHTIPAPLNPDGTVAETPEVKAAKAAHLAAHAVLGRKKRSIPALWTTILPHAPLKADGTVDETPEVKVAKAVHMAAHAQARGHLPYVYSPYYLPGIYHGETPEVVAAKIGHFAAHAAALSRAKRSAPIKPDGTVDDTADVKLAKAVHFAAKYDAAVRSAFPGVYYPWGVSGTVVDTPEVAAAKMSHFAAHAQARGHLPYLYSPYYHHGIYSGETPEVVAAKMSHFAAHAEALSRTRRSAPLKEDGTVDETPEVKAATVAHLAAKDEAAARAALYPWGIVNPWVNTLTPADTPEVTAAKVAHLHAVARVHHPLVYSPHWYGW